MKLNTTTSWVAVPANSDFPLQNLPFGIFSTPGTPQRAGVAIGEQILDLAAVAQLGYFKPLGISAQVFAQPVLNPFIALGKPAWQATRALLTELLTEGHPLADSADWVLVPQAEASLHLPVQIGDYTDFYSSLEHATNVGKMLRPDNPLMPNWKHMPIAYHGRASSIVVSGTDIAWPKGQMMPPNAETPSFGPSKRMDYELEMAFVVGKPTQMGETVSAQHAEDHIFGLMLFNDWSARDIQRWEYQPLGPFLGKNFASTVSPWIVTMEALEPFRTQSPAQDPQPLPYLQTSGERTFDIDLQVLIQPEQGEPTLVGHSNFKYLYWNMSQQLAHHTCNGCNIQVGDVMASGTISGPTPESAGSMLERTWGGTQPISLANGQTRSFLEKGDTVILRGFAQKDGLRIGFGECRGKLVG